MGGEERSFDDDALGCVFADEPVERRFAGHADLGRGGRHERADGGRGGGGRRRRGWGGGSRDLFPGAGGESGSRLVAGGETFGFELAQVGGELQAYGGGGGGQFFFKAGPHFLQFGGQIWGGRVVGGGGRCRAGHDFD